MISEVGSKSELGAKLGSWACPKSNVSVVVWLKYWGTRLTSSGRKIG